MLQRLIKMRKRVCQVVKTGYFSGKSAYNTLQIKKL